MKQPTDKIVADLMRVAQALVDSSQKELTKQAEDGRHERPTMDVSPIPGAPDYGQCGHMISTAMIHLDESIPMGQKDRTVAAFRLLQIGAAGMEAWLTAKGYFTTTEGESK